MKCLHLFSGAGGMTLGLGQAGIEVVLAVDSWAEALRVHHRNLPESPVLKLDLVSRDAARRLPRVELVAGGSPCQEYSTANLFRQEGERAAHTVRFAEIVDEMRPDYFLLENVAAAKRSAVYLRAKEILGAAYGLSEMVLDASYYGVPQRRQRLFLLGHLGERDGEFLAPLSAKRSAASLTIKEYCGDALAIKYFFRQPIRKVVRPQRAIFGVNEPAPTLMTRCSQPIPRRGYRPVRGDATDDLSRVRALTLREAAKLQTFPDWWNWCGVRLRDAWQMVANAVPPALARHIGEVLMNSHGRVAT